MNNKLGKSIVGIIAKGVAKASYREALSNANQVCVFLHGQPEMPDSVKALNKLQDHEK